MGCNDGQGPGGPDHAPHWIRAIQCGGEKAPGRRGPLESRAESRPGWPGLVDVDVDGDGNIDVDGEVVRPVLCHFSVF